MFNLFKTQKKVTVEDVHREFLTASETLLKEATKIINETMIEKSTRLSENGFKNSIEVTQASKMVMTKETVRLIQKYQFEYPFNKFIRHDDVMSICEKYSLIMGTVDRYKGFVPDKNLKELEKFVAPKDEMYECYDEDGGFSQIVPANAFKELHSYLHTNDYHYCSHAGFVDGYRFDSFTKIRKVQKTNYLICAPVKDMIVRNHEKIKNFKITVPDPIILCPVIGGYLIVTAWGDEASDPIVVNEKLN